MTNAHMSQAVSRAARRVAMAGSFVGIAVRIGVLGLALLPPVAAAAGPIELKLSFFTLRKERYVPLRGQAVRRCRQRRRQGAGRDQGLPRRCARQGARRAAEYGA